MTTQRYTVQEAAEVLGISVDAVRQRIRRGYLPSEKVDGRVYVFMDTGKTERPGESSELVEELRDRIRHLEETSRRADTIIAQLSRATEAQARTIRELEGSPATPEEAESVSEHAGGVGDRGEPGGSEAYTSQPSQARSWWRRLWPRR